MTATSAAAAGPADDAAGDARHDGPARHDAAATRDDAPPYDGADHLARVALVAAAYVYLRRGDEVLLQLRQGTGYRDGFWAAGAAGHLDPGESILDAARREASEELGVEVGRLVPLTVAHRTLRGGGPVEQRVDFYFACREWAGSPTIREPQKAAALGWFRLDALPEPVVPHEEQVLRALAAGMPERVTTYGF